MEKSFARLDSSSLTPEKFEDLKFNFNKLLAVTKAGCRIIGANPFNAGFSTRRVMQGFEQSGSFYKNGIIQTEYYEDFKKTHEIPPKIKPERDLIITSSGTRISMPPNRAKALITVSLVNLA
jgi:hypothetical protein